MDYACTALTVLNKTQRQKLEIFQTAVFDMQEEQLTLPIFTTMNFVLIAILLT